MKIAYTDSLENITWSQLPGFFVGWPHPPSPLTHLKLLQGSSAVELALDAERAQVVGFAAGLSDGVLTLDITYLEVLPPYQGQGIGSELTRRLLQRFARLYAVNLTCDEDVQPFYERLGLNKALGMMIRRYEYQKGE